MKNTMTNEEAVCFKHCSPCEWYGICPHSYEENDALYGMTREEAEAELFGTLEKVRKDHVDL